MHLMRLFAAWTIFLLTACAFAQVTNGKLQIHHIDVGQGDGAVLISPNGEVVLFDMGEDMKRRDCQGAVDYLDQLGVRQIDYIFVSHYHFDHIGCIPAVLKKFPLVHNSFDRGQSYPGATYGAYVAAVGAKRKTATLGQELDLDQGTADPVKLSMFVLDATYKGGSITTNNENDLSVAVLVSFDGFKEEIGGDLSGDKANDYQDIESPVAAAVGPIDVYKVHHHCSAYSTNETWLKATQPTVAVISTGDGNAYFHPTADCLTRLHEADLQKIYWTEKGNGKDVEPAPPVDVIGGDISIEVAPKAKTFTVLYSNGAVDTWPIKAPTGGGAVAATAVVATPKYAWSVRSQYYHEADCPAVKRINKANLQTGNIPPPDKKPSSCVKTPAP
jgi:beta-lactamase superfamily II metal-dependent hydrolase